MLAVWRIREEDRPRRTGLRIAMAVGVMEAHAHTIGFLVAFFEGLNMTGITKSAERGGAEGN
jgi:hypothetical protein